MNPAREKFNTSIMNAKTKRLIEDVAYSGTPLPKEVRDSLTREELDYYYKIALNY